jgi:transcriptional regulator with XRE-family HTH domain
MLTIRELREIRGLSLADLAEKVGVAPGVIERWERGEEHPDKTQLEFLAGLFGVATADLTGHQGPPRAE